MELKNVVFLKSSTKSEQFPPGNLPEFAFIGRSNVGKSSLINRLAGRKELAMTSSKPGKTRVINHYLVDQAWYLVDLPGYGFAKVSKKERLEFENMIRDYLVYRDNLMNVFLLVDSRIPAQKSDLQFMEYMGENSIPFSIVFTKMDKLSQAERSAQYKDYEKVLLETWEEVPPVFFTSAEKNQGMDEIRKYIGEIIPRFDLKA